MSESKVTPPVPYWAVVVNEASGHIAAESFDSRSDLVGRLRHLSADHAGKFVNGRSGYRVFVFHGRRLQISKPPHRFLLDGPDQIPLFEIRMNAEEDDSGNLDNQVEDGQDEVYRAITRKGLDEVNAAHVEAVPILPAPPAPPEADDDDD